MNEVFKKSGTHETKKREHGLEGHWLDKISSFSFLAIERMRNEQVRRRVNLGIREATHAILNLGYV